MARPIKETPILRGKDAATFIKDMKGNENKRVDEKTRERIRSNFNKLHQIAQSR